MRARTPCVYFGLRSLSVSSKLPSSLLWACSVAQSRSAHCWTRHTCEASAVLITLCSQPEKASHPGPLSPRPSKPWGKTQVRPETAAGGRAGPPLLPLEPPASTSPLQMGPSLLLIRNLCACIQSRAGELPAHPNKEGLTHGQAQNGHSSRLALKGAWIHQASLLHTWASLLHPPKMGRGG